LRLGVSGNYVQIAFDLSAETFTLSEAGTSTAISGGIQSVGTDGWYRVYVIGSAIGTVSSSRFVFYDDLYYWGAQLEEGSELTEYTPSVESFVSRASSGTYVDSDGLIKTTPVNYKLNSEEADTFFLEQVTVTANQFEAPNSTLTADRVDITTAESKHYLIIGDATSAVGTTMTASVYVKAISNVTEVQLIAAVSSGRGSAVFDLVNGTSENALAGNIIFVDSSIAPVGNDWYRISITSTSNGANSSANLYFTDNNADAYDDRGGQTFVGTNESIAVWGSQFEEGSTATDYIPTGATISGAPRYENGELLLEESRTNLLSDSLNVTFSNSASPNSWSFGTSAPDGSNDARKCTTNNRSFRDYNAVGNANVLSTYSVYLRADSTLSRTFEALKKSTGQSLVSKSITITEQWQRFDISFTSTTDGVRIEIEGGILGIEAWGAQLEAAPYATSYIPTSGSTVTRAADVSTSALGVDSWYNQSEGTVFAEFQAYSVLNPTGSQQVAGFTAGTSNSSRWGVWNNQLYVAESGAQFFSSLTASTSPTKTVFAVSSNDAIGASNGTLTAQDTTVVLPVVDNFHTGRTASESNLLNGHISHLAYFPTRLSDDKLKSITT